MSKPRVCKFYLRGDCYYGSSCRFLHSDNDTYQSSYQNYNEYQPRNNRNTRNQYAYDDDGTIFSDINADNESYNSYNQYEQRNHNTNYRKNNYHSKNNYNHRSDYNSFKNNYNTHNYDDDNYNNRDNHRARRSNNTCSTNDYNEQNNYSDNRYCNKTNSYNPNENNQKKSTIYNPTGFSFKDSGNEFNKNDNKRDQYTVSQNKNKLKLHEKEIIVYQTHLKNLLQSNIWPLTCFHPFGNIFPFQPVGSLNLIDVSFEEIRCDYYLAKNICADAGLIHGRVFNNLLLKSQQQKETILSFSNSVPDDFISTFDKYKQSQENPMFENRIQADENSYWDMSIKLLINQNKSELELFSFVIDNSQINTNSNTQIATSSNTQINNNSNTQIVTSSNTNMQNYNTTNTNNNSSLKIYMQTEVYGKMDCDEFAQDNFTNFIPIMPPPKKYCF